MATDPLIGTKLGDYNIIDLLGRGGMSRVYRGYDDNLERYAAVKVISGDFATTSEAEYTRRFQSEARAIARLRHPNIVGVYQFGRSQGIYYMAMVWLDGKDLRTVLHDYARDGQRMPVSEVLRISYDVATALDYAHEQGVIHRDIKPSNIMLERRSGRAVLMDFGLALSIHEGTQGDTFGSAHYIAPEQARSSAQAVPQSDLYSLGVVLYEMLTGRVPFDEPSAMSVALHHLNDPPPPPRQINPELSPDVERVLLQALDKDPGHRFPNGETLVRTLAQALRSQEKVERSPSQITASPVLLDMLERSDRHEDAPSFSARPSSPGGTSTPMMPPTGSGSGRLAQRFAERKAQKEQEAALQEIDEQSLQIDDQALNAILQSYDDPSELGDSWASTGRTQSGVTDDEPPPDARPRRSRVGLLLTLILLVAIGGLGAYFGLGIGREDDTGGVALNPDSPTEPAELAGADVTADATGRSTGTVTGGGTGPGEDASGAGDGATAENSSSSTASATASPAPPSETPTSAATDDLPPLLPTFADGSTPIVAEVSGTPAPTETPTPPDTPTLRPSLTPTTRPSATPRPTTTPRPTAAATNTTRPTAAESGTAAVTPAATSTARGSSADDNANPEDGLVLVYDDESLLLINNTGRTLDVSGWQFEQVRADDTQLLFEASTWGRYAARPPSQMLPESCYQIIIATAPQETPDDDLCPRFLGWYRATIPQRYFWLDFGEADTFTVYDGDGETIATCALEAGRCTLPEPPA